MHFSIKKHGSFPNRCAHPQLVQMETLHFNINMLHKEGQCFFFSTVNYSGYLPVAHFWFFGFYSLSLAIASWIMPCVSCVDSDDDVYNFTSYYFPMNWLTVRKLVHLAYIYTLWFGKLKSFFPPKMARITLEPYVSKTSDWFSRGSSWIPKMNNRCWFFR